MIPTRVTKGTMTRKFNGPSLYRTKQKNSTNFGLDLRLRHARNFIRDLGSKIMKSAANIAHTYPFIALDENVYQTLETQDKKKREKPCFN